MLVTKANLFPITMSTTPSNPNNSEKSPKRKKNCTGIPWLDDPYNPLRGETSLWVAVITQAVMDALSRSSNPEHVYYKNEAIRWLTDNSKDFQIVCLLADIDASYVRKQAKRALLDPKAWRAAPGTGRRYEERKRYRQKAKHINPNDQTPKNTLPPIEKEISGPWNN